MECGVGAAMVFTVSARDKFNNKVREGALDHLMVVRCRRRTLEGEADDRENNRVVSETTWAGSSLGIFPCVLDTRGFALGEYEVLVGLDGVGTDLELAGQEKNNHKIQESPFRLVVTNAPISSSLSPPLSVDTMPAVDLGVIVEEEGKGTDSEVEKEIIVLTREETTRLRALNALKQQRAQLQAEKEEKRRKKSVKRVGGGFLIQYSKEI